MGGGLPPRNTHTQLHAGGGTLPGRKWGRAVFGDPSQFWGEKKPFGVFQGHPKIFGGGQDFGVLLPLPILGIPPKFSGLLVHSWEVPKFQDPPPQKKIWWFCPPRFFGSSKSLGCPPPYIGGPLLHPPHQKKLGSPKPGPSCILGTPPQISGGHTPKNKGGGLECLGGGQEKRVLLPPSRLGGAVIFEGETPIFGGDPNIGGVKLLGGGQNAGLL